jgi:hypothetical protein
LFGKFSKCFPAQRAAPDQVDILQCKKMLSAAGPAAESIFYAQGIMIFAPAANI